MSEKISPELIKIKEELSNQGKELVNIKIIDGEIFLIVRKK